MRANFVITDHARQRFKQRWKHGGMIDDVVREAFTLGKALNRSLNKTLCLLGYSHDGYWTATNRVYRKMVFVFQSEYHKNGNKTLILTTIYPLIYLINRRSEMMMRAQDKKKYQNHYTID